MELLTSHRSDSGRTGRFAQSIRRDELRATHLAVFGSLALVLALGCHAPQRRADPQVNHAELSDVQFIHYLAASPAVSADEGVRAILILVEEDASGGFQANRDLLVLRGVLDEDWLATPSQLLDMGTLAYMLLSVCDVRPSVNSAISNATGVGKRRYALRACIDAQLLPYSTSRQLVRGGELVTAMTNCAEAPISEEGSEQ